MSRRIEELIAPSRGEAIGSLLRWDVALVAVLRPRFQTCGLTRLVYMMLDELHVGPLLPRDY